MSDQRQARRLLVPAATAMGVVLLGVGVAPGAVSAHIPVIEDDCGGLSVTLSTYHGDSTNNQVAVMIDGSTETFTFGSGFARTFSWSSDVDHSWTVVIDANRNSGHPTEEDSSWSGTQVACNPTTSTTTTSTTTTSTTTTQPDSTTTTSTTTTSATTAPTSDSTTTTLTGSVTSTTTTTTPSLVGQQGPTTSTGQLGGAGGGGAAPPPVLPATGPRDGSIGFTVVTLTMVLVGAVMLRLATKPTR